HFKIRCAVRETRNGTPLLLSHEWRQIEDVEDQRLSVRITEGEVRFALNELIKARVFPDQLRTYFVAVHPIPKGFQPKPPHVEVSNDNRTLAYRVVDRMKTHTLTGRGWVAQRIAIRHAHQAICPPLVDMGTSALKTVKRLWGGYMGGGLSGMINEAT